MSKEPNVSPSNSMDIGHAPPQIRKHDRSDLKRLHNLRLPTPPPDPTLSVATGVTENTNMYEDSYPKQITDVPNKEIGQETILKEIEFLEYLSSLSTGYQQGSKTDSSSSSCKNPLLARTNSVFSQVVATEDAFDHLDKLYKLMEQLLNLREQNSRLQKRVRDLEHFKMLQEMHMRVEQDFINSDERLMFQDLESDPVYAESLLDTMLAAGRNASNKRNLKLKSSGGPHSRFRQSILRKSRDRSSSVAIDDITPAEETFSEGYLRIPYFDIKPRRASAGIALDSSSVGKPSKVSKWTKVKAAFKWEKASPTVNGTTLPGAKSQDSGIGGMLPTNNEVARYLRVPSIVGCHGSSSGGVSPADSVLSGQSSHGLAIGGNQNSVSPSVDLSVPATPGSLSSASSIEDVNATEEGLARSRETSRSEKLLHQRLSTCSDEEDMREQQRRSKSYDEEITLGPGGELSPHFNKDDDTIYYRKNWPNKLHKTPWGKVKDIIQTRKDSLRKSRNRSSMKLDDNFAIQDKYNFPQTSTERCRSSSSADVCSVSNDHNEYPEVFEPPSISKEIPVQNIEPAKATQKVDSRQTPTLTVTIPQTNYEDVHKKNTESMPDRRERERRSLRGGEIKQTKNAWRKSSTHDGGLPQEVVRRYQEIVAKDKEHSGKHSLIISRDEIISDTETSPQTPRRNSRWTFVKKAFLSKTDEENSEITSTHKPIFEHQPSLQMSASQRNIPICSEFSTNKDDLTNPQTKRKLQQELSYPQSNRKLQEEIRKNYEELQNKLSLEFQEKLQEWERMKCSNYTSQNQSNIGSATTSSAISDTHNQQTYPDTEFQKKIEEWERMKQHQTGFSKVRDPPTTPLNLTSEENLSADFKKKLQEWERMKKLGTINKEDYMSASTGHPSSIVHSSSTKKKITDWQFFRSSGGHATSGPVMRSDTQRQLGPPDTKQLSDDFLKKLEEWKHMKATNTVPTYATDDDERYKILSGNKTPSPDVQRKDSSGVVKIPRQSMKKIKTQEEKELQWLEKELQKIEREKQRLEREREKFLEREERLAKLRRSIGNNHQKKEVLVQTSTGFFRFEGISRKFTQRLYEWEKARGIGPEESTLMLLNPAYHPALADHANRVRTHKDLPSPSIKLTRSKSVDSVANFTQTSGLTLVSSQITHHASSLSLNDMEELEAQCLADSRMSSEPDRLHDPDEEDAIHDYNSDKEPEAVIVDVEDVVVETAAALEPTGRIKDVTHTPVYKVTQQEFDTMCEMQKCIAPKVQESVSTDTQSTYYLIEEILSHLQKIITEENVCQQLESKIDELNEKCNTISIVQNKEMEKLWKENRTEKSLNESTKIQAKSKIKELQQKKKRFKQEGVILMNSFIEHCSWQNSTVQNIVKSIRKLQEACNIALSNASTEIYTEFPPTQESFLDDVKDKVQELSTELVSLAEQLQILYTDRKTYVENMYKKLKSYDFAIPPLHSLSSIDLAAYNRNSQLQLQMPQINPEEKELPVLLNSKILELKRLSSYLCAASDMTPPGRGKKSIISKDQSKSDKTLPVLKTDQQLAIEVLESEEQKPKSPVTNVTITPKFLKKSKPVENVDESNKTVSKSVPISEEVIGNDKNDTTSDVVYAQVNIPLNAYSEEVEHKFVVNIYAEKQESPRNRTGSNGTTKRKLKTRPKVDIKLKEDSCSDDENASNDTKKSIKSRKLIRTKRISSESPKTDDGNIQPSEQEANTNTSKCKTSPPTKNEDQAFSFCKENVSTSNVIVSTCNQFVELVENQTKKPESPVEIFVKTTRKLFTPIGVDTIFAEKSVKESHENEEPEASMPEICENDKEDNSIDVCIESDVPSKENDRISENTVTEVIRIPRRSVERRSPSESPASKRKVCFTDPPDYSDGTSAIVDRDDYEKIKIQKHVLEEKLRNIEESDNIDNEKDKSDCGTDKIQGLKHSDSEIVIKPNIAQCQTSSLPPLPHSPIPSRRERIPFKETAPSIRLMIARYNQRLSEQDGGKSPGGSSGSASPVAWRSPVAERRVRAQTERYQEEIKRVLQQDGSKYSPRRLGREIMKSASAGVIRINEMKQDGGTNDDLLRRSSDDTRSKRNVVPTQNSNKLLKGILKSSSAGSIKSEQNIKKYDNAPFQFLNEKAETSKKIVEVDDRVVEESIKENELRGSVECITARIQNTPPRIIRKNDGRPVCQKQDVPPSTELTLNSPLSKIRALKIQKAKEEFLTRQVNVTESISTETKSESTTEYSEEKVRVSDSNRLSQVSYGSESSYDDCNTDGILVKSASAGMINVDADTYHKLSSSEQHTDGYVSLPRASKSTKDVPGSRFGIGSIASKFRKVKMRRNKQKEGKMNTVSMLCRQSLFVDLNDAGNNVHGRISSLSVDESTKSVSVSPVLQRQSSSSGKEHDTNSPSSSSASSWIKKTKIFKSK